MGAEAESLCGAGYGERCADRVNSRNGYRTRRWDTRVGTIHLAIPKLRQGSYFKDKGLDYVSARAESMVRDQIQSRYAVPGALASGEPRRAMPVS